MLSTTLREVPVMPTAVTRYKVALVLIGTFTAVRLVPMFCTA
jgi:hypothetical protein